MLFGIIVALKAKLAAIEASSGIWKMEEDSVAYIRKMRIESDIARTKKLSGWIVDIKVKK